MKKVLSLALALAMVLSLGVVALADGYEGYEGDEGYNSEYYEEGKYEEAGDEEKYDEDKDEEVVTEEATEPEDDDEYKGEDDDGENYVEVARGFAGIAPAFFPGGWFNNHGMSVPNNQTMYTAIWTNGLPGAEVNVPEPVLGVGGNVPVPNFTWTVVPSASWITGMQGRASGNGISESQIGWDITLQPNGTGFVRFGGIDPQNFMDSFHEGTGAAGSSLVAMDAAVDLAANLNPGPANSGQGYFWVIQRPESPFASWVGVNNHSVTATATELGTNWHAWAGLEQGSFTVNVPFGSNSNLELFEISGGHLNLRAQNMTPPGVSTGNGANNWFQVVSATIGDEVAGGMRPVTVTYQINTAALTAASVNMVDTNVTLSFGGYSGTITDAANALQIVVPVPLFELSRTIFAGRTEHNLNRFVGSFTYGGSGASLARWNALPVGTVLSVSHVADLGGVNPRAATGTLRIDSGSGATRQVTITLHTVAGTGVVFPAHFTLNRTQPGVPNEVFHTNSGIGPSPQLRVIPNAITNIIPTQGQVPNNWRVDGLSASGELRIQLYLSRLLHMTGDDVHRITVIPSDFTWRIPNTAITGMTGSGFQTEQNWEIRANQLLGEAGAIPATLLNEPFALRSVHFERTTLRTTRTVNMSGTIRDVEWHWGSQNMAIRVRTPEFMARTGTTTVEFDLNMAVTGASNRLVGRATLDVANERVYVYENQEFIDPSRTEYLRAEDTIRQIDIYAGEGVTFRRNITRGQSIYVQAEMATHDAWDELFRNHAELVDIIVIHHAGMAHAASAVTIDRPNTYFVYDAERRLIGTTADNDLPFSGIYFLTTAQIDIGGATLPEDPAGAAPELQDPNVPVTGGDGGASNNVNLNPGTGR